MGMLSSVFPFIFIATLLVYFPAPILTQCCDSPILGVGTEASGTSMCASCIKGEFVLKKQESSGKGISIARTLKAASRIVLEDTAPTFFENLETLSFNASDFFISPEPLIRIRRSAVTTDSFSKLHKIEISPLEPYCQKGTIYDIDGMDPVPLERLKNLEKEVLKPCATLIPTTLLPKPCVCNETTQATSRSPPQAAAAGSQQNKDAGEGTKDVEKCSYNGTIILTILGTSLVWFLFFLVMVFILRSLRAAQPPPEEERIFIPTPPNELSILAECVEYVSYLVHDCHASLAAAHTVFAEDTSLLFEIIESRTAHISSTRNTRTSSVAVGSFREFGESVVARQKRLTAMGETLYETDIMNLLEYRAENVAIEKYDQINVPIEYRMEEIFVGEKTSNKNTYVDILEMNKRMDDVELQRSDVENVVHVKKAVMKEQRKNAVQKKTASRRKKAGEEGLNIDEGARESASRDSKASRESKFREQMLRRKTRPGMVNILNNMVYAYRVNKYRRSDCDKTIIKNTWLSLGAIVRLLTEMETAKNMMKANYDETKLQLCRVAMSEIKERCLVNNREAYGNQRKGGQKGQVFDMHSFAHVLDHLNFDATYEKEDQEVLKFVNEYEYIRYLELHYMGLSYTKLKGKFVYTKPVPRPGELISAACKRVERQQEFYEKVQKLVKEYAARKKLNLKTKIIPPSIVPDKFKFETTTPEPVNLVFTRGIAGKGFKIPKKITTFSMSRFPDVASKSKETENKKSKKKCVVPGPLLPKKQDAENPKSKHGNVVTGPSTPEKQEPENQKIKPTSVVTGPLTTKKQDAENPKSKHGSVVTGPSTPKKQESENQESNHTSVVTIPLTPEKETPEGQKTSSRSAAEEAKERNSPLE
ncbi:unnamed protein product [Caenorhabditis auriculariae]|uniref:Uncharacterized protein n=1 Tax=Caenorhabditis auriculariae TaxID=2777116 RepID=A0A8S1H7F3_9PELO|nr:unnamed protein product [Caenorhabditis auriculariae]